jgi:ubiquinone/menaquinone biosynthesis C-methylase UbiE
VQQETKRDASRKHFDRWAPKYETDRVSRWLQEAQSEALAALELRPDDSLLDIGCGTGAAVRDAAAYVDRAVGFDLSPAMVARARMLADGLDNVQFYGGDASERLPFDDGEFTAIVCTSAFHHFPEPAESVREMERVLAPGGRVVIADANAEQLGVRILDFMLRRFQRSHVGFYRRAQLEQLLTSAGLRDPIVWTLWKGGYAVVRADKPGNVPK